MHPKILLQSKIVIYCKGLVIENKRTYQLFSTRVVVINITSISKIFIKLVKNTEKVEEDFD
jgi:hypothetical protein